MADLSEMADGGDEGQALRGRKVTHVPPFPIAPGCLDRYPHKLRASPGAVRCPGPLLWWHCLQLYAQCM